MKVMKVICAMVALILLGSSVARSEKQIRVQVPPLKMDATCKQRNGSLLDACGRPLPGLKSGLQRQDAYIDLIDVPEMRLLTQSEKKLAKGSTGSGGDGNISLQLAHVEGLEGFVQPGEIDDEIRKMVGKYRGGGGAENVAVQKARGVIETGLYPDFIDGANCPEIDSEKWAIDYSRKRGTAALHKGVDIPQPRGTPIRAVADGVVVGRFMNDGRKDGIAVVLRHTPEQTGLTFWTYSQYTHLREMSPLPVGTPVKMGDEIGKTSNTGKMGKRERRDALHYAMYYSAHPEWSNDGEVVTPKDGYFMDPNAFYRLQPPHDSQSMLVLPSDQKNIPVPYMKTDGTFRPSGTKRIWPYPCR